MLCRLLLPVAVVLLGLSLGHPVQCDRGAGTADGLQGGARRLKAASPPLSRPPHPRPPPRPKPPPRPPPPRPRPRPRPSPPAPLRRPPKPRPPPRSPKPPPRPPPPKPPPRPKPPKPPPSPKPPRPPPSPSPPRPPPATPACSVGGKQYDSCYTRTTPLNPTTIYYKTTNTSGTNFLTKVAVRSPSSGWLAWAQSVSGMYNANAIFAVPASTDSGAATFTAKLAGYSADLFQEPWGLSLQGSAAATKLPGGELLLEFEFAWPQGENSLVIYVGTGAYQASNPAIAGLQKHTMYPSGHQLFKNGAVQFW